MNHSNYVIIAYAVGLGLMLSYALLLWIESRKLSRRQRMTGARR
jgi:hypothetical protein